MKKVLIMLTAAFAIFTLDAKVFVRRALVCGEAENFRVTVKRAEDFNCRPVEGGKVKVECDGKTLKFILDMIDSDIFNEAEKDQVNLSSSGDSVTILLKSEKDTWLWEFIVSPNGKRSCFLHPGAGRMFYPELKEKPGFSVKNAITQGNWLCEVTIPQDLFKAKGLSLNAKDQWKVMIVRRNYSRFLPEKETSCYPQYPGIASNPDYFADLIIK